MKQRRRQVRRAPECGTDRGPAGRGASTVTVVRAAMGAMVLVLSATIAQAQSAYVAGSLSADVARNGSVDDVVSAGSGEAFSFSLRVGTAVTPHFGVELDFTRPSEIEVDRSPDPRILAEPLLTLLGGLTLPTSPIIGYQQRITQRSTTITASAWARQELSPRFSLVYLGGIAFGRIDRSIESSFNYLPALASIYPPVFKTRTIDYDRGPMVGLEARLGLGDHAQLLPGVRLLSIGGGWIVRPGVGLAWAF